MQCENFQDVTVGASEEGRSHLLLFSLLSTLPLYRLTRFIIGFATMPSPYSLEWEVVDTHFQMVERSGFRQGLQVVLRTRPVPIDVTSCCQSIGKQDR